MMPDEVQFGILLPALAAGLLVLASLGLSLVWFGRAV